MDLIMVKRSESNSQTLANLLVIFEDYSYEELVDQDNKENGGQKAKEYLKNGEWCEVLMQEIIRINNCVRYCCWLS